MQTRPGLTKKLTEKFLKPFIMEQVRYPLVYITPENTDHDVGEWVHVNRLKTYFNLSQDLNPFGINLGNLMDPSAPTPLEMIATIETNQEVTTPSDDSTDPPNYQ